MRGKIENTIPQRQYENLRTTYYFETEDERKEAIETSLQDCIKYAGIVGRLKEEQEREFTMSGLKWKRNNKGKWVYEVVDR